MAVCFAPVVLAAAALVAVAVTASAQLDGVHGLDRIATCEQGNLMRPEFGPAGGDFCALLVQKLNYAESAHVFIAECRKVSGDSCHRQCGELGGLFSDINGVNSAKFKLDVGSCRRCVVDFACNEAAAANGVHTSDEDEGRRCGTVECPSPPFPDRVRIAIEGGTQPKLTATEMREEDEIRTALVKSATTIGGADAVRESGTGTTRPRPARPAGHGRQPAAAFRSLTPPGSESTSRAGEVHERSPSECSCSAGCICTEVRRPKRLKIDDAPEESSADVDVDGAITAGVHVIPVEEAEGREPPQPADADPVLEEIFSVHQWNVGNADAAAVHFCGVTIVIDAGSTKVVNHLREAKFSDIDLLILTHAHRDHVGGVPHILRDKDVRVKRLWHGLVGREERFSKVREQLDRVKDVEEHKIGNKDTERFKFIAPGSLDAAAAAAAAAAADGGHAAKPTRIQEYGADNACTDLTVDVLVRGSHVEPEELGRTDTNKFNENRRSLMIGLHVTAPAVRTLTVNRPSLDRTLLFMGDAEPDPQQNFLEAVKSEFKTSRVDYFKTSHHGSNNNWQFLNHGDKDPKAAAGRRLNCGMAVMSSGRGHNHPGAEAEAAYREWCQEAYITGKNSAVDTATVPEAQRGAQGHMHWAVTRADYAFWWSDAARDPTKVIKTEYCPAGDWEPKEDVEGEDAID